MKNILITLAIAVLIATLSFTSVSASTLSTGLASNSCGITYKVKSDDSIAKIAHLCGMTIAEITALNPQIANSNLIYAGQILRLDSSADWSVTQINPLFYTYSYFNWQELYIPHISYTWSAQVGLSHTSARAGASMTVTASGFPPNMYIDYRLGRQGQVYSVVYDGVTDSNGNASTTITIPLSATSGEHWVVLVITTGMPNIVSATSAAITIQ